ncbi:MAG: hypothetical protein WBN04_01125, partial [Paracoccaceae bacterium]
MIFLQLLMGLLAAVGTMAAGGSSPATDAQVQPDKPKVPPVITDDTPDNMPVIVDESPDEAPDEPPMVIVDTSPDTAPQQPPVNGGGTTGEPPVIVVDQGPDEAPQEPPVIDEPTGQEPQQPAPGGNAGEPPVIVAPGGNTGGDAAVASSGQALALPANGASVNVMTGRVTTLELPDADNLASVRILDLPQHGNVTVNPDNTLALVLTTTDHTGAMSFKYEATYNDGSTTTVNTGLNAVAGTQDAGWGKGEFYMLETDEDGEIIVEHGDNHRKVFVSNSNDALSLKDIAALEGIDVGQINDKWLVDHPDYGADETMALAPDAGMTLWKAITGVKAEPSSNW